MMYDDDLVTATVQVASIALTKNSRIMIFVLIIIIKILTFLFNIIYSPTEIVPQYEKANNCNIRTI